MKYEKERYRAMKKLISVLLALFMLAFSVLPSFAAKSVKFTASDSEVFAGDEFTVDIFISDYSRLKSATLIVEYDEKAVQFLDLNIGAIVTVGSKAVSFKDVKNADKAYIQIDYKDSSASLSSAGKFISLTFVANDTAAGKTDIKLSVSGNKISVSSGSVTPEFQNGKINIINNEPVITSSTALTSEESSSSEPAASENPSSSQNAVQNSAQNSDVPSSQNSDSNSTASDKTKEKRKNGFAVVAVVITVVVICAVMFGSNGNVKKRPVKRKRKKKRKSRR